MELGVLIEKMIREAQAEGKFDDLQGRGRPLRLDDNPHEDPARRMANDMLKQAGFKPEWLMLDQEMREAYEQARQDIARSEAWRDQVLARLEGKTGPAAAEERAWVAAEWDRALAKFREALEKINDGIFKFNLKAPSERLHRMKLDVARELEEWGDG